MTVLVVDVGTSGLRAAVVRPDPSVDHVNYRAFPPDTPFPGLVEVDAVGSASWRVEVASASLAAGGPVAGRRHHQPAGHVDRVGPGHRRAGRAGARLAGPAHDRRVPHAGRPGPALRAEPVGHEARLAARHLRPRPRSATSASAPSTRGWRGCCRAAPLHVTDRIQRRHHRPAAARRHRLGRPRARGPAASRVACCPRSSTRAACWARPPSLDGAPPIAGLAGDQQASLIGQGGVAPGRAKATFGTGGMLDLCIGPDAPAHRRPRQGRDVPDRGVVDRRRDHLGRRGHHADGRGQRGVAGRRPRPAGQRRRRATTSPQQCADTGGVVYVPALLGLGTPAWDYGARGTLLGLTRGSGRAEVVRAVLEGVAQRGADLLEAAEADTGHHHRDPARRRRHERQRHLRPGPGRRHRAARRGVAGGRGHHGRRRHPGRTGRRGVVQPGRDRPRRGRPASASSRRPARPGALA